MTTRSKILIGNLLLQLLYSIGLFVYNMYQYPNVSRAYGPGLDFSLAIALTTIGHFLLIFIIAIFYKTQWKSWLLSLLLVLLVGFSVCAGGIEGINRYAAQYQEKSSGS